jgi:2,4-diketo-3-deoxy-L-fuconate hydrolase
VKFANANGRAAIVAGGTVFYASEISGGAISDDPQTALQDHWERLLEFDRKGSFDGGTPVEEVRLGPAVPNPRAVFGIGLNYRDHAAEAGMEVPKVPPVFTKFPTSICGPFDDLVIPSGDARVDYEAELVFVVGREAKGVDAADALDYLAGFTCGQDYSERTLQMEAGRQFSMGKSYDTFFPIGPYVVSVDEVANPSDLSVRCSLNGETVQDGKTADMVFGIGELLGFLSSVVRLRPGDVCLTGTPSGVGFVKNPPRFLAPGDIVETEIESVGYMRNRVVAGYPEA